MRALFMSRDLLLARARSTTALRHSPRMGSRVDSLLPCMRRRVIKSAHRLLSGCRRCRCRCCRCRCCRCRCCRCRCRCRDAPPCPHEPVPMTRTTATSYGQTSCGTKQLTHIPFGGARHGACPPPRMSSWTPHPGARHGAFSPMDTSPGRAPRHPACIELLPSLIPPHPPHPPSPPLTPPHPSSPPLTPPFPARQETPTRRTERPGACR